MNKETDLSLVEVIKYRHWCGVYPDCHRVHGEYVRLNTINMTTYERICFDTLELLKQGYTVAWKVIDDGKTLLCAIDTKMFQQR
jgi:hypothetical protein